MELAFDISQDELPIFLAETEDHLQILDEGLIRLERQDVDSDLIQQIFRAAHTLKGTAGMIGHQRLVELTHALEMAFDGIRKNELVVNSHLIDICLDAVDALRLLREEVVQKQTSPVNVKALVDRINEFIRMDKASAQAMFAGAEAAAAPAAKDAPAIQVETAPAAESGVIWIEAKISSKSIASAARAFQIMLALQDLGEITFMDPNQETIETAAPIATFSAKLKTQRPPEEVKRALSDIAEIESLDVHTNGHHAEVGTPVPAKPIEAPVPAPVPAAPPEMSFSEASLDEIAPHLGQYLVTKGFITPAQLQQALEIQKKRPGVKKPLIGQVLVDIGILKQTVLQQAIADLLQQQRSVIQTLQQATTDQGHPKTSEKTVRTSVERLDTLMNLVGELITDRNRLFKIRADLDAQQRGNEEINVLVETVTHIGRITDQLQEEVMRIRMLPVSNVFNKFPRMVRDLAQKVNKEIQLVIQGQDTELDRSVIEEINDPLIHLLRNAIDHGIEPTEERVSKGKPASGTIKLTARHEQGRIILTVEDDGRGLNIDKLKAAAVQKGFMTEAEVNQLTPDKAVDLIFISGLTTASRLTDISGRGVGMDIVRSNIEKINGSILVETHPGAGTRFQIVLPLTLAIVPTLLVRVGQTTFAIPLVMVTETVRIKPQECHSINGNPVILLRNHVLPIMKLSSVFGSASSVSSQQYLYVVVVATNKIRIGLVVDALIGEEEVVVKSLGGMLGDIAGISSAAILGDGQVALIVDIPGLFKLAGIH
jgi:two-component system, chemotaxis family, sensor kinase CheA